VATRHSSRRSGRVLALTIAAVLAAGLLWSIGSALAASTSPSPAGTTTILRIGTVQDADNLNPFIGYSGTAYEIFHLDYDMLVGYSPKGFAPRPELATSWQDSPDGKTWTFHIRHGVTWQDGVPLTASDVAFTYNYIIKNDLFAFTPYTIDIVKAVATDPYTVKFILDKPKADMLRLWVPIVPQHVWSKISGKAAGNSFTNVAPIVGSGPFQVVEIKKSDYIRLVANKHYWGGAPKVDEVIFQVYQNAETMVADLKDDHIQAAEHIPVAEFNRLSSVPGVTPIASNVAAEKYFDELAFNCYDSPDSMGNPVLLDPKFRQALAWAVDKQKIVQVAYGGRAVAGSSIVVPGLEYAWQPPASEAFGFDLAKAGQMLTAAGYPLKNGVRLNKQGKPIVLRLLARNEETESQVAGKLITSWFGQLGLKIKFSVVDEGVLSTATYNMKGKVYAPDYDMFLWGWGEYVDPNYILGVFTKAQIDGWNDCCWTSPAYDKLYSEQAQEMDPVKRAAEVQQMQQLFYDAAPYVVLAYQQDLQAYNSGAWEGWVRYPSNGGMVVFSNDNIDSYRFVQPKPATAAGGTSIGLVVGVIVAALVVVIGAVWVVRRRRSGPVEEL
jgi:peptide/nickel transport system substrate-binding protein